jgi:hypothetical protein
MNYYVVIVIFYNPLALAFVTIVFIEYVVVELGVMGMKTTKSMGFPKLKQEQGCLNPNPNHEIRKTEIYIITKTRQ